LIPLNIQSISIINNKYHQFEYKTNVASVAAGLNYFNNLSFNEISLEITNLFCKSNYVGPIKLYHIAIDESLKSRVNSGNDSMMTVTVYYYSSKGTL